MRRRQSDSAKFAPGINRRKALQWTAGGMLAGWISEKPSPLPPQSLLERDPETYWLRLRDEQFLLGANRIFLNPASLGVVPRSVLDATCDSLRRAAEYATDKVPRWGYETLLEERQALASFFACAADELVLTQSCTAAMSLIANGLDLQPGDEVLSTDQEHESGIQCWRLKAARTGSELRVVRLPTTPTRADDLIGPLVDAIGPRTRVLSFSGVTSQTGLRMPVSEICRAAREKGVLTVVDGAHMHGHVPTDVRQLECDFFAGSAHKWLLTPAGCGFLIARREQLDRLWPAVVTGRWDDKTELGAARLMMIGTNNLAVIDGFLAAIRFIDEVGLSNIHARTQQLGQRALDLAVARPYLELITPRDSSFYHAIIAFRLKTDDLKPLWKAFSERNINVLTTQPFRLSVHVHTRPADIDAFFQVCDAVLG
jgi:selenocysteine lyase/cysteine desulfurase